MRRIKLGIFSAVVAAGTFVGVAAVAAPPAHAADFVEVCFTLNPRQVSVDVNGRTLLGQTVAQVPRTCAGV